MKAFQSSQDGIRHHTHPKTHQAADILLNYVWLIVAGVAFLVTLALAKQVGNFRERYRRPVNLALLIVAIGFAPLLLAAFALTLFGTFHLVGKLAQ